MKVKDLEFLYTEHERDLWVKCKFSKHFELHQRFKQELSSKGIGVASSVWKVLISHLLPALY